MRKVIACCLAALAVLIFAADRISKETEMQPGTPEYTARFNSEVQGCTADAMAADLEKTRLELPRLPTKETVTAECEAAVIQSFRIYPVRR